jgi:hypothetical protein
MKSMFGSRTTLWANNPIATLAQRDGGVLAIGGSMMDLRGSIWFIVEGNKCIDRTRRLWRSNSITTFVLYSETCNTVIEQVNDMDIRMRTTDLWHSEA